MRRRTLIAAGMMAPFAPSVCNAAGMWERRSPVPWNVQEVYGSVWREMVVIVGGMAPSNGTNPLDRVGLYDAARDRWTEGPKLPSPRHHPVVATARDRVYAMGGFAVTEAGSWVALKDVLVFQGQGWEPAPAMRQFQCETVALTLGERIHLVSGRAPRGEPNAAYQHHGDVATHQVFDTRAGKWESARPCPMARNSATGGVIAGALYVAGGRTLGGGNTGQLERYDPKSDAWTVLRPMPQGAGGLAGAVWDGKLYVFGGEGGPREINGGVIPNTWSYNPKTDAWTAEAPMPTPRHGLTGAAIRGRIYAVGGGVRMSGGQVSAVVEAFRPA